MLSSEKRTIDLANLNEPYDGGRRIPCEVECALEYVGISAEVCPQCGGELEWRASVGSLEKRSEIHFFQCKGCDHVHTSEKKYSDC